MLSNYCLLFKTGDAELRCLANTDNSLIQNILPIIEITRGRKLKGEEKYPIGNRLKKIYEIFPNQPICLDLTSSGSLLCDEIRELFTPINGYEKWLSFLRSVKENGEYTQIIPCIQSNFDDENFVENYRSQVTALLDNFSKIAYRSNLKEEGYYDDIEIISQLLTEEGQLLFIIDCEYLPSGSWRAFADKTIARINNVYELLGNKVVFTVCSTSFPNNISDIGNDTNDTFKIIEIELYNEIIAGIDSRIPIIYGDYGSISPKRNDEIIMARGWIPRIDVPTQTEVYYVRERRTPARDYSRTYTFVAQKVMSDHRFPHKLSCWGVDQIKICAEHGAPGASPSFWISVRMNIHLNQQMNRLIML
jgi:hypothetical protein